MGAHSCRRLDESEPSDCGIVPASSLLATVLCASVGGIGMFNQKGDARTDIDVLHNTRHASTG
jgi:hypothetical protein